MMYEEAKQYKKNFGNLEVQKRYITDTGCALGNWLSVQRNLYGEEAKISNGRQEKEAVQDSLTQERIRKLSSLGMRWENYSDAAWNRGYEACQKFRMEHGDLLVPLDFVTEDGMKLGIWISQMRAFISVEITVYRRKE